MFDDFFLQVIGWFISVNERENKCRWFSFTYSSSRCCWMNIDHFFDGPIKKIDRRKRNKRSLDQFSKNILSFVNETIFSSLKDFCQIGILPHQFADCSLMIKLHLKTSCKYIIIENILFDAIWITMPPCSFRLILKSQSTRECVYVRLRICSK